MKRIFNAIIALFLASYLYANIIPIEPRVSELYFDSTGGWVLEIGFLNPGLEILDSIQIKTQDGIASVLSYDLLPCQGIHSYFDSIAVITNTNLSNPLQINIESDFVIVYSYMNGNSNTNGLGVSFGDPDDYVISIAPGQSISYLLYNNMRSYCLDLSPTIGAPNDTVDALGILKGQVLLSGNPAPEGRLWWYNNWFDGSLTTQVDSNGSYFTYVHARRYSSMSAQYDADPPNSIIAHLDQNALSTIYVNPGEETVYNYNFAVNMAVDKVNNTRSLKKVIPYTNPFSNDISFYIDIPKQYSDAKIEIFCLDGKSVKQLPINRQIEKVNWLPKSDLLSGAYVFRLVVDGVLLESGKIVKQ